MITYELFIKQVYSYLTLFSGLLFALVITGCASRVNVTEIHESYSDIQAEVPEGRLFSDTSDAAIKGFLGGFTPQGLLMGGPLVTGPGATLYSLSPCIEAMEKVDQPLLTLQAIIRSSDPMHFSSKLRSKVIELQNVEQTKRFDTGGLPYGDDSKDITLVIENVFVKLDGHIWWDMSCRPQLHATAAWHIIEQNAPQSQFHQYTSCNGRAHKTDFADWFNKPLAASEEINDLLGQLAQAVATEVTSGYSVSKCGG
jgi:hypothetical protein